MRIPLVILALAWLAASPGEAQLSVEGTAAPETTEPLRWVRFGITATDTLWYDPETVRSPEEDVYTVWVLESRGLGGTLPTGERYALVRELADFDCDGGRSRRRELIFLTREESLVKAYSWADDQMVWREPVPGSDAAFILRELCERVG